MKLSLPRPTSWLVALCCVAGAVAPGAHAAEQARVRTAHAPAAVETEARVIVKFKADSSLMRAMSASASASSSAAIAGPQHAKALSTRLGLTLTDGRVMGPRSQLMRATGLSSKDLAEKLSAQTDVEYAVVDGRMHALGTPPNDPLYLDAAQTQTPLAGQWYLQVPGSTVASAPANPLVSAINAEAAWAITIGNPSVVVADLDTGVRFDHPDLTAKLLAGYDFITDAFTANDGNGRDSDPSDPGDWVTSTDVSKNSKCNGLPTGDSSWHGTQTAGLIGAATNNGIGMASIGHDVMVLPVRVLGKCGGQDSDIIDAMRWAAGIHVDGVPDNTTPAKVLNMSLGSTAGTPCGAYQDAVNDVLAKNVVIVVAAGNDGLALGSPANCVGVIAVGGVRNTGTKVGYSDLGPGVTISAPAGNCINSTGTCIFPILSTSNSGTTTPVAGAAGATYTSGGNDYAIGTSFATPLVSGTVALMLSANSTLTPADVTTALKASARAFPSTCAETGDATCATNAVTACVDPATLGSAAQDECFCTTTTCGAGLLDAGAAVASVARLQADISGAPASVVAGTAVTLDATYSNGLNANDTLSYQWAITGGADIATLANPTAPTATLTPTAAGTVTVSLTVSDSAGALPVTTSTTLSVTPAATTSTGSSSGGGGAFDPRWLLALMVAVALLWAEGRRRR